MGVRAAIYCRCSEDRSTDASSVTNQERDCRALCERLGWEVVEVFVDNSKSAWRRNRRRPGWDAMLEGLACKAYDAIVAYHGDRLMRQPRDLEDLLDAADRGVKLASPTGSRDLADPDDRFVLRIEVAHACRSSDDTSRRARDMHRHLAEAGKLVGSGRPFGYARTYDAGGKIVREEEHPVEADVVREAARRILAGETLRSICSDLGHRGFVTTRGGPLHQSNMRRILTSWRIAGIRSLKGVPMAPAPWPALVDEMTHRRLRAVLLDPSRRVNDAWHGPRLYLLPGFLRCGKDNCDKLLISRGQSGRRRTYVCTSGPPRFGCGGIRILAPETEAEIAERLFTRVDTTELAQTARAAADAGDEVELLERIATLEADLDRAAVDHYRNKTIGEAQFFAATRALEADLGDARAQLARRQRRSAGGAWAGQGEALRVAWPAMSLDVRRAVLTHWVEHITVSPATPGNNRWDPNRLRVTWRA